MLEISTLELEGWGFEEFGGSYQKHRSVLGLQNKALMSDNSHVSILAKIFGRDCFA